MANRPYANLWARLMALCEPAHDGANACWLYTRSNLCRYGYGRVNVYVPGLQATVKLTTHILTWLLVQPELQGCTVDELYLAYLELRHSDLELDHGCVKASCMNPDCLEPLTPLENIALRDKRRRMLRASNTS